MVAVGIGPGEDVEGEGQSGSSGDRSTRTPKLEEWLQHIPETSELSAQKSAVLGTAKIVRRTLQLSGLW